MSANSESPAANPADVGDPAPEALALKIVDLALKLWKTQSSGKIQQGVVIADILVQMAQTVDQAYQANTGRPLDPSLIRPETV